MQFFGGAGQLADFRDRYKGAQLAKLHEAAVPQFWRAAPSKASSIGRRDPVHRNMRLDALEALDFRLSLFLKRSSSLNSYRGNLNEIASHEYPGLGADDGGFPPSSARERVPDMTHDSPELLQCTPSVANDEVPDSRYWTMYDHYMIERQVRALRRAYVYRLIANGWRRLRVRLTASSPVNAGGQHR